MNPLNGLTRRNTLGAALVGIAGLALGKTASVLADTVLPLGLDAIAQTRGLRFGTAIAAGKLNQRDLVALIDQECGVIVAENAFKWKQIEPQKGSFDFKGADAIASFADNHKKLLRGHNLVWPGNEFQPDWMKGKAAQSGKDTAAWAVKMIRQHVALMISRFPDIMSWDVVNEAVKPYTGKLNASILTQPLGDRLLDVAFKMARQTAPKAQLVYNDYMSWGIGVGHRDGVLRLLEGAIKRGVPIDALGIQSHLWATLDRPIDELAWRKFLEEIEAMGLDILITELDCSDRNVISKNVAVRDAETAAFVKGYLDVTLSFKRTKEVLVWGLCDRDSYMNAAFFAESRRRPDGLPLRGQPYDTELQAKPMRQAIANALAAAPARS
ncbi:MAG: endo-1,4-beta-xylanase [Asticcacaulis sp.]